MRLSALLVTALAGTAHADDPATFADVVHAAERDNAGLPPEEARYTRYLDLRPLLDRDRAHAGLQLHANQLSREPDFGTLRWVTSYLLALRIDDFAWQEKVWEDLARVNAYYCVKLEFEEAVKTPRKVKKKVQVPTQVTRYDQFGRPYVATETVEKEVEETVEDVKAVKKAKFAPAPWLPKAQMDALVTRTRSATPIVMADHWYVETSAQEDQRAGHGYFDFLQLKSRKDAEDLAGLDRAGSIKRREILIGIVRYSGVANNNRQLWRFPARTGPWWESHDADANTAAKNAWSNYVTDYKHTAEETSFRLPNRLIAWHIGNQDGVQVKSVPGNIASNHRAGANDRRIHCGHSCNVCHIDSGMKPFRCDLRNVASPEKKLALGALAANDPVRRLIEAAHLGPIYELYEEDRRVYEKAVRDCCGLGPLESAQALEWLWTEYLDHPVKIDRAAAEVGTTPDRLKRRLLEYADHKESLGLPIDPVIATLLIRNGPGVRREHWEERFVTVMAIWGGANP